MSHENVEIARRLVEWFNAGDVDALKAHTTDDVEIVPFRAELEDTVYRGPGAAAASPVAFALRDAGERVVAIGQLSARARGTGAEVSARLAMLFEFRGAQLSKARSYTDVEEALEAAGL